MSGATQIEVQSLEIAVPDSAQVDGRRVLARRLGLCEQLAVFGRVTAIQQLEGVVMRAKELEHALVILVPMRRDQHRGARVWMMYLAPASTNCSAPSTSIFMK